MCVCTYEGCCDDLQHHEIYHPLLISVATHAHVHKPAHARNILAHQSLAKIPHPLCAQMLWADEPDHHGAAIVKDEPVKVVYGCSCVAV